MKRTLYNVKLVAIVCLPICILCCRASCHPAKFEYNKSLYAIMTLYSTLYLVINKIYQLISH